ncbi:MAG: hypothetical protein Q8880_09455 [Bacteroidota bacterium]|nr:hypothetical protein [Bacteroidota bacterium]
MSGTSIFLGMIISTIGLAYFIYGKKAEEFTYLIAGIVLMVYPYLISNVVWTVILGIVFCAVPVILNRL